jgi:predicted ArsR family transcriptional regulator
MDPTGPRHYRVLAEVLADTIATGPDPSSRAVEAGRAWGRHQVSLSGDGDDSGTGESVDRLVTLLNGLGFAPERREHEGQAQIGLRHCPFLELAANRSEIVCPVHLGLMQGAMDAWHSPITVDRLDAFVEPDLCLAHLTSAGAS